MLNDILETFCLPTGYDKLNRDTGLPNPAALNIINRGAKDLYNQLESDAMMREVILIVTSNLQVSLPAFIGEVRGLREYNWGTTIPINEIGVPRFSSDTWKYKWRNWTYVGKRALASNINNASQLVFISPVVTSSSYVSIRIVGKTDASNRVEETLILNATTKNSVNSYSDVEVIACFEARTYDIEVQDIDGNTLAVLYNNESKTQYNIYDISQYAWIAQVGDGITTLVEVLYKVKFYKFKNLADEFAADGYDDAIAYKGISLWCQGKSDKEQDAALYQGLATAVANGAISSDERGQTLKLQQAPNTTYRIFARFRQAWNWRRGSSNNWPL